MNNILIYTENKSQDFSAYAERHGIDNFHVSTNLKDLQEYIASGKYTAILIANDTVRTKIEQQLGILPLPFLIRPEGSEG